MFFSLLCFVSIKNGLKELTTSKLGHKCHKMTANAFFWDILLWDIFELAWPPPPPISSKYFYEWKEEEKIVTWWPSLYAVICFFKSLHKSKSEHCHRSFTLHKKNHVQFENFGIKDRNFMITGLSTKRVKWNRVKRGLPIIIHDVRQLNYAYPKTFSPTYDFLLDQT